MHQIFSAVVCLPEKRHSDELRAALCGSGKCSRQKHQRHEMRLTKKAISFLYIISRQCLSQGEILNTGSKQLYAKTTAFFFFILFLTVSRCMAPHSLNAFNTLLNVPAYSV